MVNSEPNTKKTSTLQNKTKVRKGTSEISTQTAPKERKGNSQLVKKTAAKSASPVLLPTVIKVGKTYNIQITALTSANVGLNEFKYGFPILIGGLQQSNATLGDLVQVQICKIARAKGAVLSQGSLNQKIAVAKVLKVVKKAKSTAALVESTKTAVANLGKTVEVTLVKKGPKGTFVAEAPGMTQKIVLVAPTLSSTVLGQKVTVQISRIKATYAFATLVQKQGTSLANGKYSPLTDLQGSKFSLILPKKAKRYCKHIVIKLNYANSLKGQVPNTAKLLGLSTAQTGSLGTTKKVPTILFIKPVAGAKLGDKVQIKVIKAFKSNVLGKPDILIAKIAEVNPVSSKAQKALIKTSIKQMLNSGMHFGEKAVKCNARMKNYVWTRKKGYSSLAQSIYGLNSDSKGQQRSTGPILIQKGRNLINLLKTRRCLNKALAQLSKYAAKGKTFLFVGTKKAAAGLIARASLFSKKAFFVNTRWLGGMLTNWKTILKSISKIRPILKEKQVIIKDILQKRQNIQTLLMDKAFLLKKKSQFVLKKGRQLLQKLQANTKNASVEGQTQKAIQKLVSKRKEFVQTAQILLEKRQLLLQKRKQVISQSTALYQKALVLMNNSKEFVNKATLLRQKLRELKALLFVSQQLQALQQTAKAQNSAQAMTISYGEYKQLDANLGYVIPNPPKEILTKIILLIKKNSLETSNVSKKDASKMIVLTKLLSQFISFAPSIKASIKVLVENLKKVQSKLSVFQETFKAIGVQMTNFMAIKTNIVAQLRQIQQSLTSQRNIIRIVKRKFKQILAQKRFIQFLPKLRYLPTPSAKIAETVQVLMKKIVDPKFKYPIDSIYDQKFISQTKKVAAMRKKKWQRLEKYLGGIFNMTHMNPRQIRNNVAIIIGQQEEMNAVRECQKLGIKMFHVVDTNCNPGFADHFIPANDDSRNSIQYILTQFLTRIRLAQKLKKTLTKSTISKISGSAAKTSKARTNKVRTNKTRTNKARTNKAKVN